jgi:MraZ protein
MEPELFVGRHLNKVDKKGRVSVPKPFRSAMNKQSFAGVYVFPQFKYSALEACSRNFMELIAQSLNELPMFSDDQDDLSIILENTHCLPIDNEGRIVLPKDLLVASGIGGSAMFVGRGGRFQIWCPKTYESIRGPAFTSIKKRDLTLSLNYLQTGLANGVKNSE